MHTPHATKKTMSYNIQSPAREHHVYGHVELGAWGNVLDIVHLPYNDTTYVLRHESQYGTTGGLGKDVVLYAVTKDGKREIERNVITHQFDRSLDCLSAWNFERIRVDVRYSVTDLKDYEQKKYNRDVSTEINIRMVTKKSEESGCYVSGSYIRKRYNGCLGPVCHPVPQYKYEQTRKESSKVEPGELTKEKVQELLKKWNLLDLPKVNPH